jgi:hypothetical protein
LESRRPARPPADVRIGGFGLGERVARLIDGDLFGGSGFGEVRRFAERARQGFIVHLRPLGDHELFRDGSVWIGAAVYEADLFRDHAGNLAERPTGDIHKARRELDTAD